MTDTLNQTHGVSLTDQAATKVRNLLEQEDEMICVSAWQSSPEAVLD